MAWPLDTDALEDLRWYLEDYLRAPFRGLRAARAAGRGPADRVGAGGVRGTVRRRPGPGRLADHQATFLPTCDESGGTDDDQPQYQRLSRRV